MTWLLRTLFTTALVYTLQTMPGDEWRAAAAAAQVRLRALAEAVDEGTLFYVTDGGAGMADGSDWNNALDGLPINTSAVRHATYYIADGDYLDDGWLYFNEAANGTERITFKKATVASHGIGTGWDNSMGDGQAVFDGLSFGTPYWTVNGQVGSGTSGYGIKVQTTTYCVPPGGAPVKGIDLGGSTTANNGMHVEHVEITVCGEDILLDGSVSLEDPCLGEIPIGVRPLCGMNTDGIFLCADTDVTDLLVSYVYIHELTRDGMTLCSITGGLIEHMRLEHVHGVDEQSHGQGVAFINPPQSNVVFRWNTFVDVVGSGGIAFLGGNSMTYDNMQIYGNLFYTAGSTARYWYSPSAIYGREGNNQTNFQVYNNTFYNIVKPRTQLDGDTVSGSYDRNNLFVNSEMSNFPGDTGLTRSHNAYYNNTGLYVPGAGGGAPAAESNQQDLSGDPFTNAAGGDFTLSAPTTTGFTLSSPFDVDIIGVTRGQSSTWDRGAYEKP